MLAKGSLQIPYAVLAQSQKQFAMRDFTVEASLHMFTDSSSTPSRPGSRKSKIARSRASRRGNLKHDTQSLNVSTHAAGSLLLPHSALEQ